MSRIALLALAPALVCLGCPSEPIADPSELPCEAEEAVVSFTTDDGVKLVADYQPAATSGRGAVVLVHMIPPNNDRSSYPIEVRQAIADLNLSVLNLDRRGAGSSEGVAEDAYIGEGGRLDVEAAVRFLMDEALPCAVDPDALALVGASNGTTSVMDYLVGHDASLPSPAAAVWMSPGGYTEQQNRITTNRALLDSLPLMWLYPTNEPYSDPYAADPAAAWRFVRQGEAHGTRMFDGGALQETTTTELVSWFDRWITP